MSGKKRPFDAGKLVDRFYALFIPEPNSGCWLWIGSLNACGYGTFGVFCRSQLAHRVSYAIHKGPYAKEMRVLHRCDMPCCVNPEHLFLGTQADNVADMEAKKRAYHPKRALHGRAKLTEEIVRSIKVDGRSSRALAKLYGVSKTTVLAIRKGKIWKDTA